MKIYKMLFVLIMTVSIMLVHSRSINCPNKCSCYLDKKGRNTVVCKEGGITGPITLTNVSTDTEVLNITAPEDNMNILTMVPIFGDYKKLEEIHITRSNIPQLGMHFFWGLEKLDVLNLSQNNITQPLDHNFRGLSHLKALYLDDNRISSLPSGTFRYLRELRILSIQRNRIEEMTPRIFLEIRKLQELKLSGNRLRELNPQVFEDVQELRTLECRGCALKEINNFFHLLPNLLYLDLGDNEFRHLRSVEFEDLPKLKHLKLDGNQISTITDYTFMYQNQLKKLNLARNELTHIENNGFNGLENLTDLDLSNNKLETFNKKILIPAEKSLERLYLNGNHIPVEKLKHVFKKLPLRELHMANMGLTDLVHDLFPHTLLSLNLAENHISCSSFWIDTVPLPVTDIDISKNRFRGLNQVAVQRLLSFNRIKLDRNPWACDLCHIVPLLELVTKKQAFYDIVCFSPHNFEGKALGTIKRSDLTWCITPAYTSGDANYFLTDEGSAGLIAAGASVTLTFLIILIILASVCYTRRHAAKYYTHEDRLADDSDSIFDHQSPLFTEDRELSFKFPLDLGEKKLSISTIDEIKKEHSITNGT